jgi:DNA-binding MarR family transcriptional regulator
MQMTAIDVPALATGLDRLTRWLHRQTPRALSSSAIAALDRLATEGPLRVSDLAAAEAITQPGVTTLVHRLAQGGYAERVPDPSDGRAALVRITARGRAALAERFAARADLLQARLATLSSADQRLIAAALPAIERLIAAPADASRPTLSTDSVPKIRKPRA